MEDEMAGSTTIQRVAAPTLVGLALLAALSVFASGAAASRRHVSTVTQAVSAGRTAAARSVAAPAVSLPPGSAFGSWSVPVNLGPLVNSDGSDTGPALSPDGLSLYFNNSSRPGFGSTDIYVSQRPTLSGAWGSAVNLGPTINTAASEFVPSFSPDGHWMFFASDRAGGFGGVDLYQSYRGDVHNDFGWQTPANLGANVNSPLDDNGNGYFENAGVPQLYFGSSRLGTGVSSLYISTMQADKTWGPATLTTLSDYSANNNRPVLRQDGLEIFFYSNRAGAAGGSDLWVATRPSVTAAWSSPVSAGSNINTSAAELHPSLSANGRTLVFTSDRAGYGSFDLYMSTRNPPPDLQLPKSAIRATTSNPRGRPLELTPVASEVSGGQIAETCTPTLPHLFKVGTTFVHCAATGSTGDSATGSFKVTVSLTHAKKH
jgi:hypothetical protein